MFAKQRWSITRMRKTGEQRFYQITTWLNMYYSVVQILAALIVSLWQLIDGSCASVPSTILYSLERGSEGITMSMENATFARK